MKKFILVFVLILLFSMTTINAETIQSEDYTDLDLLEGEKKETTALTRYELCKVLVKAAGLEYMVVPSSQSIFTDIHDPDYEGYVSVATGLGYISGYADGTFRGEELVSVEEASFLILLLMN